MKKEKKNRLKEICKEAFKEMIKEEPTYIKEILDQKPKQQTVFPDEQLRDDFIEAHITI